MENSTLEILLKRERIKIMKYLSENMEEILVGTEKIFKICANETRATFVEIIPKKQEPTTRPRLFPTSIMITRPKGHFPGESFIKVESDDSD